MRIRNAVIVSFALTGIATGALSQSIPMDFEGATFGTFFNSYDYEDDGQTLQIIASAAVRFGDFVTEGVIVRSDEDFNEDDFAESTTVGANLQYQFGSSVSAGGYFRYIDVDFESGAETEVTSYGLEGRYDNPFARIAAYYGVNDADDDDFVETDDWSSFGVRGDYKIRSLSSAYLSYGRDDLEIDGSSGDLSATTLGVDLATADFLPSGGSYPSRNWYVTLGFSRWTADGGFFANEEDWNQYTVGVTIPIGRLDEVRRPAFNGQRTLATQFFF